jgi:Flp pilus assembly protein TadD
LFFPPSFNDTKTPLISGASAEAECPEGALALPARHLPDREEQAPSEVTHFATFSEESMIRLEIVLFLSLGVTAAHAGAQIVSERNHHDAMRHYRLGAEALGGERFEAAEHEFREAIRMDPMFYFAHYGLGQVYMQTKRYPLAVRAYLDARDAFKASNAEALTDQAAYGRQLDDQIHALEDTKHVLENGDGPRPRALNINGAVEQVDRQIAQLKNQRRRVPERPAETPGWMSLALGSAYFRTDALADAEREYRHAVRVEPRLGEAHNNLAVVLMLTGRCGAAEDEIRAAEKSGFRVNQQFKDDLLERRSLAGKESQPRCD